MTTSTMQRLALSMIFGLAFSGAYVAAAPNARRSGRGADACQQAPALTKGEIRTVYRILESHNPFPEQAVRRATPLMWAVASALGQATSLHASCVYVHLMILVATTLGAVQIKYGGILSRHCNLLMLQHGQPGDGKSVALWLDVQVLAFFDMIRERRAKKKHEEACQKHKDDPENHPEPAKKEHVKDTIFNKGTFIGLGNFMQAQGETAFLALHEGKTWLPQTFDNGPGGGIDDLNQIHDHDMYKNHPGNTQNRFLVRNPHLCGAVMMHIEELYDQAQKPDTTAGMMRFLIGHFPAVVNKIRPDVPPSQITRLLQDDPDYFNDLDYDDVVTAIGKIMLVASALYVRGVERADEKDNNRYSRVRGTHFLPWKPEAKDHFRKQFNRAADYVREEARASKGAEENSEYAAARKDMTRTLQFIPPVDIGEKVIDYLLKKAGKTSEMVKEMTGEDIVTCLGKGTVPHDFVDSVDVTAIAPEMHAASRGTRPDRMSVCFLSSSPSSLFSSSATSSTSSFCSSSPSSIF